MPFLPSMLGLTLEAAGGPNDTYGPRSQRIRASRRGGQLLTRTQGPSNMNGLPDLRSLPDAPVPDGRTVLTNRDARGAEAVMGHGRHLRPFILDTNAIEALNRQLRKAIKTKGHFPNEETARKLIYLEPPPVRWRPWLLSF